MKKPIAVYYMSGTLGINIYEIDDYSDSIFWCWSNESQDEYRESSINYDMEGQPFFKTNHDLGSEVYLNECIKI